MSAYESLIAGYSNQEAYCRQKNLPIFIYENCTCHKCGRMIFGSNGISPEDAGKRLITGCPYCHASFCD